MTSRRQTGWIDEFDKWKFVYWPVSEQSEYDYYINWVEENLVGDFCVTAAGYHFQNDGDAAMFLLTWGYVPWP